MCSMGERLAEPTGELHLHPPVSVCSSYSRLPFMEDGILQILSNATDGLSIVLEHRYYGDSIPVESFSTDDLRFLNNAEALEDSAYVRHPNNQQAHRLT